MRGRLSVGFVPVRNANSSGASASIFAEGAPANCRVEKEEKRSAPMSISNPAPNAALVLESARWDRIRTRVREENAQRQAHRSPSTQHRYAGGILLW